MACARKSYCFIPVSWYESSKELSIRKRRPLDPLLGRYINRYLLAGRLGEGGMGTVYVAIQKPLGREVALKLISGIEISGAAISRFEREARAIALLDHPNIVKLHDYGIGDLEFQVPYMAIEYVRHGRTLRRAFNAIKKESGGRIPGEVVLTVFRQVLNALSAAHEDGLVHRDMKPDNVLIVPFAGNPHFVKVLDFGLAKAVSEVSGFDGDLSHTGLVLGTPHYMAPEQAPRSGHPTIDARADLFAVNVMLYEVFTGVRPFTGASALAILTSKTDPSHRPLDFPEARSLPGPLRAFLEKGFSPQPETRYADANEMLKALENALAGGSLDAMGPAASGSGSSQDRPMTPPSPPADGQALEPTKPLGSNELLPRPDVPLRGNKRPTRIDKPVIDFQPWRKWWPYALGSLAGFVLLIGIYLAFSGNGETRVSEKPAVVVPTPEPPGPGPRLKPEVREPVDAGTDRQSTLEQIQDETPEDLPPSALPPPATVTRNFVIKTRPGESRIQVDGKHMGSSPATFAFETTSEDRLEREVTIVVSAKGYRTQTTSLKLADAVRSGKVEISLKRKPRRKPKPRPKPPPDPNSGVPRL